MAIVFAIAIVGTISIVAMAILQPEDYGNAHRGYFNDEGCLGRTGCWIAFVTIVIIAVLVLLASGA